MHRLPSQPHSPKVGPKRRATYIPLGATLFGAIVLGTCVGCAENDRSPQLRAATWPLHLEAPDDYRWPPEALFQGPRHPSPPLPADGETAFSASIGPVDLGNGVTCPSFGGTLPNNPDPVSGGMCWFNDDPFKQLNPWYQDDEPGGGGGGGGGGSGGGGGGPGGGGSGNPQPPPTEPCKNEGWDDDFSDGKAWGEILDATCESITGDPLVGLTCWDITHGTSVVEILECTYVGETCWGDRAYICESGGWFEEL